MAVCASPLAVVLLAFPSEASVNGDGRGEWTILVEVLRNHSPCRLPVVATSYLVTITSAIPLDSHNPARPSTRGI